MSTIQRIKIEDVPYEDVLRKVTMGEWSVVRTADTHEKPEHPAEKMEMIRVHMIGMMARGMAKNIADILDEILDSPKYEDYSLRRGRIHAYTGVLSDLVNRL